MRIGVIGKVGPDLFAENVGQALQRLGHDVAMFGSARGRVRGKLANRALDFARGAYVPLDARLQSFLAQAVIASDPDLIISLDSRLSPEAVTQIRRSGIRTAFWFPDAVSNLVRQFMILAPYDAVFFKEPHIVERLKATLDLPVHYLPQGCNPDWHRPVGPPCVEPYFVVAGNMYPSRVRLLERLVDAGIPLRLYGGGFPRWLGPTPLTPFHSGQVITREHKARIFRSAAGVINSMHPAEVYGVNSRLFEATACGAAVVSEYRRTVPDHFEVGKEILTYDTFDELLGHARRLLDDRGLGGRLGDAGARRSLAEHTYDKRLAHLLHVMA